MTLFDRMMLSPRMPQFWKDAVLEAIKLDPMDATNQAQYIAAALWERAKQIEEMKALDHVLRN